MKISAKSTVSVVMVWFVSGLAACSSDSGEGTPTGKPTGATCDPSLTYDADVKPIIDSNCLRCHISSAVGPTRNDAPVGVDFDTEDMVKIWALEIELQAAAGPDAVNTLMPGEGEIPQPSEQDRFTLGAWLACQ